MKYPIIEACIARAEKAIDKAIQAEVDRIRREVALPLLNRFQKKVREPIQLFYCNGDIWLDVRKMKRTTKYVELSGALDMINVDSKSSTQERQGRYDERIIARFPELLELWALESELEKLPGMPTLDEVIPTAKPRKTKK